MPTIPAFDLPQAAVDALQPFVGRYNQAHSTDLDVARWVRAHLLELAVQDAYATAFEELRRTREAQANADLEAASKTVMDDLVTALADKDVDGAAVGRLE